MVGAHHARNRYPAKGASLALQNATSVASLLLTTEVSALSTLIHGLAASALMIPSNGGVLESEVPEPGSEQIVQRYVVSGVR
jgi:hypothetical protein